jgi:hypothetical protein
MPVSVATCGGGFHYGSDDRIAQHLAEFRLVRNRSVGLATESRRLHGLMLLLGHMPSGLVGGDGNQGISRCCQSASSLLLRSDLVRQDE